MTVASVESVLGAIKHRGMLYFTHLNYNIPETGQKEQIFSIFQSIDLENSPKPG